MKDKNAIKNLLFDFGGVIINIDHQRVEKAFMNLGVGNFDELYSKAQQSHLFIDLEKGFIEPGEFREGLRKISGLSISDELLDLTWNEIIGDYPPDRIDLLKKISKNYNLYLLSNTNIIHYNYYISKFMKEFGFDFNSLFRKTYWSFKIGKRKPDREIFEYVADDGIIIPGETLFLDDSEQNINAASESGYQVFHITEKNDIFSIFDGDKLKSLNFSLKIK
jgi:putative hydrolase of the HAD superfamily